MDRARQELVKRYEKNPIITHEDIPIPCNTVFNAATARYKDEYILLLRVEALEGNSFFALARSEDGFNFNIEQAPVMKPAQDSPFSIYEKRGVEDPRITKIDDTYYILYTAYSRHGPRLGLAKTVDFKTFERIALISQPENKDGVLFPRKIKDRFVRFDRPATFSGTADMWISYSEDLIHWGDSRVIMETRPGFWDANKIGAGAPPIETDKGWLEIYHGVKRTSGGNIYRLGCAIFDLDDPSRLIGRSRIPVLTPKEYYERTGDVPNVIFTCGVIPEPETGEVKIYYGAGDTCICVATARLDDLLESALSGFEKS
ncbi:MAG: glycoside hydrolase family 130 protein [Deltaproteobacteria bacterium]|nr:glycoside hydrolase family 130 protein [Deltaproteobacteria bacterium]